MSENLNPFPDRVSYSSWQQYRSGCQWRWKLDVVDKHRAEVYGVHMDFGTCVHGAIEKYRTRKDAIPLQAACELFENSFREVFAKNKTKYKEKDQEVDLEQMVQSGIRILQHLDSCDELRQAEVLHNEHKLFLPIDRSDHLQVKFKGYIDMVVRSKDKRGNTIIYILDFKTCSWGWSGEKRRDNELAAQLFLYKHFFCKKFNLDPKDVRTAFVLLKKRPPANVSPVEFFPVSAGPVAVQRALDSLSSDLTDMDTRLREGTILKNRNVCKNEYGEICPYFNTERCPGD